MVKCSLALLYLVFFPYVLSYEVCRNLNIYLEVGTNISSLAPLLSHIFSESLMRFKPLV